MFTFFCKKPKTDPSTELAELKTLLLKIMALLDDLKAQVARNAQVDQSAITLLQGLKTQLDAAGTDPVALKELSDQLGAQTNSLAAAVTENTPAAPAQS